MTKTTRNIITLCVLLVLSVALAFTLFLEITPGDIAFAEEYENFDSTYILTDLMSLEGFSLSAYPKNANGEISIINFAEYGYGKQSKEYGLYFYIYNPTERSINVQSTKNKISIATGYGENGMPNDYKKFILRLCSVSTGDYANRFYKLKVVDTDGEIVSHLKAEERRYDVAEMELLYQGNSNATAFSVGKSFYYSGYAKSFGPDKEVGNLSCRMSSLDTISLQVHQTTFKFQNNVQGGKQVSSVYFSAPEIYFFYGVLKKIKAEWEEYKTQQIIITSNETVYNSLHAYVGVDIGTRNKNIGYKLVEAIDGGDIDLQIWAYNSGNDALEVMTKLVYLFYTDGEKVKDFSLTAEDLIRYIESYPRKNELFLSTIDEDRAEAGYNVGYNVKEIDADDRFDLLAYPKRTLWERLFASMYDDLEKISITDQSPIKEVKDTDLIGDDLEVSRRLLVDEKDVSALRSYYASENGKGNRVYLFRFAVSDYESRKVAYLKDQWIALSHQNEVYRAQQTVFLDFDIIQLTFEKNQVLTVIPVVSSPVHIAASVEAPIESKVEEAIEEAHEAVEEFVEEVGNTITETITNTAGSIEEFFDDITETVTGTNETAKSAVKTIFMIIAGVLGVALLGGIVFGIVVIVRKVKKKKEDKKE